MEEDFGSNDYTPCPEDYPDFRLPRQVSCSIRLTIVQTRGENSEPLKPASVTHSLRLYEFIVLDRVLEYSNALEAFWRQRGCG